MAPTSFPLFPKLPTELRLMIWEHALPAPIEEQPLYFYNQTRWTCGVCEHDIITDEKRYVNFQHGQVAPLQINIPLYFVNREAHKIALSWGVQQGLDLWPCQSQERTTTFARLFNPETDILYVAARYWSEFWYEDLKTIRRLPQLLHKPVIHPPLKYLALSAKILRERPQHFGYMLARYRNLQKVFIVAYKQIIDEIHFGIDTLKGQGGWRLEYPTELTEGSWDPASRSFQWRGRNSDGPDSKMLRELMDHIQQELVSFLRIWRLQNFRPFKVQLVFAVRV